MSDLGKAYVQIIPSAKGISGSISKELGGESTSAGKSAGLNIVGAIKGVIAAAGIGTAIKSALDAGGNLQQSFGGLDTLYGEAADGAKKYAAEAAKAGISANTYAEQAVSFGAALKQAYGGDTQAAMEAANVAILDMADNAAKMGTPIESIQTAYQGFAKQNYTMLDNLKLGYGGTKSEMERLLADAQELSGVEYNMDNLGDVYSAIHVIQENLGLTGVAAQEASTTFTGSLGAMKAAGENLLANLALGEDIGPALNVLEQTVNTFVFQNLIPMLSNIVQALPQLISGVGSMLIGALNQVSANADQIVSMGIEIVTSLVTAIVDAAPYLLEAAIRLVAALGEALLTTDWTAVGTDLMNTLRDSVSLAAAEILGTDDSTINGILSGITAGLPNLLQSGVSIITEIANGIFANLPQLSATAGELLTSLATFLLESAPMLLESGANLLLNLVTGLIDNLPMIMDSAVKIITQLVTTIASNLPRILQSGIEIIGKLAAGLIQAIPKVAAAIVQVVKSIFNSFKTQNWGQIGLDIVQGIANGLTNAISYIVEAAKGVAEAALSTLKGLLHIESPSKDGVYVGEMLDRGFAGGIEKYASLVDDAVSDLGNSAIMQLQTAGSQGISVNSSSQESDDRLAALMGLLETYLPEIANAYTNITLEGDAGRLFRLIQRESVRNTQLVGVDSVLSAAT